jgi:hypothetical protein
MKTVVKERGMKRIGILIILGSLVLLSSCNILGPSSGVDIEPEADFWQQMGSTIPTSIQSMNPLTDLELNTANQMVVAYKGSSPSSGIYVRTWDSSSWSYYGSGPLGCLSACYGLDIAINPTNNHPVLAYIEDDAVTETFRKIFVGYWDGTSWNDYPGTLNDLEAYQVEIKVGSDGNPVVAWFQTNGDGGYLLYVRKWSGTAWVSIDTNGYNINNHSWSNLQDISLALDSSNHPIVAWAEDNEYEVPVGSGNYIRSLDISVIGFNGTSWVTYGSTPLDNVPTNAATQPSLALNASNQPMVAWTENGNIYVKRWNGSSWASAGSFVGTNPALSIRQVAGTPVTMLSTKQAATLRTRKLQGSSWVNLATLSVSGLRIPLGDYLALDSTGQPFLGANTLSSGQYSYLVFSYRNNSWQPLADGVGSDASTPSIDLKFNNDPVVAYSGDGQIFVQSWTSSWNSLGNVGSGVDPSLALDSNNGDMPFVAFTHNDGIADNVYVKKYDDNVWLDVGSALGVTSAYHPSLAIRGSFAPHVAFTEANNIYVKTWDGTNWQAVGGALDRNINNPAYNPSLALDSLGNPVVAWQEVVNDSTNIYVKRWSGTSWVLLKNFLDVSVTSEAVTPSLTLRTDNRPVVAWSEAGNIYVKRWNGNTTGTTSTGSWVAYTSNSEITPVDVNPTNLASQPHIGLSSTNQPVIAFRENGDVFVRQWKNTTIKWQTITSGAVDRTIADQASYPAIALQNITGVYPIVTWQEGDGISDTVFVSRF